MTPPPRLCVEHGILVSARRNRATRISSESAAPPFTQLKGPRPTYRGAQQETCPQHAPRSAPKGSRPDSASGIVFHAAPRPRPGHGAARRRGYFAPRGGGAAAHAPSPSSICNLTHRIAPPGRSTRVPFGARMQMEREKGISALFRLHSTEERDRGAALRCLVRCAT